ncbi:hypothetical protein AWC12_07190 [Mycolicibacterium iranicum]|uniref:Uncharacterized protein n=1 Tax=Mycolicibacterium iranicum TaxID=912594 RepID=A0A1X1WVB7_MYCIR|nr:hypothetical protein AWC12_07190 [Mycolicibacterium iranicum]
MSVGEMHKAISTEDEINFWEAALQEIQRLEVHIRLAVELVVALDELGKDVSAEVVNSIFGDVLHPEEVATRYVEDCRHAQLCPQCGQTLPDDARLMKV